MRRTITALLMASFLTSISFNFITLNIHALPTTTFYVCPSSIIDPVFAPCSNFTFSINVSDASYLYSWQVYMSWNSSVLEFGSLVYAGFLSGQPEGSTPYTKIRSDFAIFSEVTDGDYAGISGDGSLCSVTFNVKSVGETTLAIDHPTLTYYVEVITPPNLVQITAFTKEDGYFNNLRPSISATVDLIPDPLVLKGRKGGSISAYIELPEGYNVNSINISTVKLNCAVYAKSRAKKVGDYDKDGIPDLRVKFAKKEVIPLLSLGENTLTVIGEVNGIIFAGSDSITVIQK